MFRHLVREHLPAEWQRLGRDWTFGDYPFQTFTFAVMRARPGMGPHVGVGPAMLRRVAAGETAAVAGELRTAVQALLSGAPATAAPAAAGPPPESDAVRAGREAIQTAFGITVHQEGDRQWTVADLADLRRALGLLTARERTFVRGFHLWRFTDEAARRARFGNAASPQAGALTELDDAVPPQVARISVYDETMGRPQDLGGGIRSTQRTIGDLNLGAYALVHEFGHTIEGSGRFNAAIMRRFEALLRGAREPLTDQPQAHNPDVRERFCEAFARFHTDPDGLAGRSRAVADFFRGGGHLP